MWEPISQDEFESLLAKQKLRLSEITKAAFERFEVPVHRAVLRRSKMYGDEEVFVVASAEENKGDGEGLPTQLYSSSDFTFRGCPRNLRAFGQIGGGSNAGQSHLTQQPVAATPASPFSEGKQRGDAGVAATEFQMRSPSVRMHVRARPVAAAT